MDPFPEEGKGVSCDKNSTSGPVRPINWSTTQQLYFSTTDALKEPSRLKFGQTITRYPGENTPKRYWN